MKRRKRIEILDLEPGSKFSMIDAKDLQGVVLDHTPMGTTVYWYKIPDRWLKKHYDDKDGLDEQGNIYIGMDTLFHNKKMIIGSESEIFEITKKEKENKNA